MQWLPIFLAAKALAATTYTVTILNDEPDRRTLSTPSTTAAGDVISYVTLYPDGVNTDGRTRYALQTGATASHTVTSFLSVPTSTSATGTASGTLTQTLPWQQGHHIEVITVTEPDGTVHEVTRIDQQSTHVTVSPSTKSDGKTVLVSSGLSPTTGGVTTTTVTASPTTVDTREKIFDRRNRAVPFCDNGRIAWETVPQPCWPIYDMMLPTPLPVNTTRHFKCKHEPRETINNRIAYMPMNNASAPTQATSPADSTETAYVDNSRHHEKRSLFGKDFKAFAREASYEQRDECALVQDVIDYGTCNGVKLIAKQREYVRYQPKHRKAWILRYWWIPLLALLGLFLLCLLPCLLCCKPFRRNRDGKNKEAVTVSQEKPAAVAGAATGATGGSTTGTGGGSTTGAGGAGNVASGEKTVAGGTTATGPAPTGTAAPAEVVTTTTTEPANNQGTMRRAAEEGRAGQRVRFDGQSPDTPATTTHQIDGTAELRTGSEVFDVGSIRGRKRNRGDEPL